MYKVSKLKNGITVITVPVSGTRATTVLAMFPVGSRYETPELSGASHFVEHMLFKGTTKRPTAAELSGTIEQYGADYNAFTSKDYTGYYVKIDSDRQLVAFDILADMLGNSLFEKDEVEKEKGAIVEELRMYRDNPSSHVDFLADQITFKGNQLGWDIGGTDATVRKISREALWKHFRRHYAPRNMVLVVAGNTNAKQLKQGLGYFSPLQSPPGSTTLAYYKKEFSHWHWPAKPLPLAQRVLVEEKKVDQAQVVITFPGIAADHPDRFAVSVLLNILGSGMSSRLFVEVREKRGLAYSVQAGAGAHREVGVAYVQAGLDPARLGEALAVIKAELVRIAEEPVTADELANAKTNFAGRMALGMEDSSSQAQWYAKNFLFNKKIHSHTHVIAQIQKVSARGVQRVAKNIFIWSRMRLAVIAPFNKEHVLKFVP